MLGPSHASKYCITINCNGRACNSRKTAVLSCHRLLINSGVEKNEQHLNMDQNFDHQMSLSKSKCLYSNNCLCFLEGAVPLKMYFN